MMNMVKSSGAREGWAGLATEGLRAVDCTRLQIWKIWALVIKGLRILQRESTVKNDRKTPVSTVKYSKVLESTVNFFEKSGIRRFLVNGIKTIRARMPIRTQRCAAATAAYLLSHPR